MAWLATAEEGIDMPINGGSAVVANTIYCPSKRLGQ